ncbi:hypothetical protein NUTIK01_14010 [Novosphingobium sp. IK01]|uniref:Uncharacterized protein n=1 Tax=Novosphingobium pituita TaxID=3056842 RepID=A0ABQ6P5T9_9SPHN|nr:hypothetical protein NUTIK01_14010 [Novosphingobium sp. IK01]
MELLHVRVVAAFRQDLGNHAALFGDAQATFGAKGFEVDHAVHTCLVKRMGRRPIQDFDGVVNRVASVKPINLVKGL